jgi:hypothetical protein
MHVPVCPPLADGCKTQMVSLGEIAVPTRRMRAMRPGVVDQLAESIDEQGLLHPILLRPRTRTGIGYILVAGLHRLEAVKKLRFSPGVAGKKWPRWGSCVAAQATALDNGRHWLA